MHSLNVAQNGIELGQSLLAAADIGGLLTGGNGLLDCSSGPEWRNPLGFDTVRTQSFDALVQNCDDGRPLGWEGGYQGSDSGKVFLRFSNNPEEEPDRDTDSVVILRSLGAVESRTRSWSKTPAPNLFSLVEARLRQQRPFESRAALTLVGHQALLDWSGGTLIGGPGGAIAAVQWPEPGLLDAVRSRVSSLEGMTLEGSLPLLQDFTQACSDNPSLIEMLEACLEGRLETHLLGLAGRHAQHVRGCSLRGAQSGLVVSSGDVELSSGCRLSGVLVHVGGGLLTFRGGATVRGAVWAVAGPDESLHFRLEPGAEIAYEADSCLQVSTQLKPTLIYWRILFPEMVL